METDGYWHGLQSAQPVTTSRIVRPATRWDGGHFAHVACHQRRAGLCQVQRMSGSHTGVRAQGSQS